jgi:hypothetical protein
VPFWLAVAPMVSTKRPMCGGSFRFSFATFSEVGSVALLEAVENAVSIALCTAPKNCRGPMPAYHLSTST